jgi:hypothetical protein
MLPSETTGDLPELIGNEEGLYEGNLTRYFRVVFFKASNLNNPYHNFRHTLHVVWLCHKACRYYRKELTPRQMRNLLVAALFHDFDHPGHPHPNEEDPDRVNISIAVAGLQRHIEPADREFLPQIQALIEATHFPYKAGRTIDLPEEIIRDADMAQALNPVWIQQVVLGLAQEAGIAPLDILRMQPTFLGALTFNTQWARELFPQEGVEAKIDEARTLLRLLDGEPV